MAEEEQGRGERDEGGQVCVWAHGPVGPCRTLVKGCHCRCGAEQCLSFGPCGPLWSEVGDGVGGCYSIKSQEMMVAQLRVVPVERMSQGLEGGVLRIW